MLLLSLLGEQPIPNLMPLWQYGQFSATQFAATRATQGVAETLARAIAADPQLRRMQVLPPLVLEAYDPAQARLALAAALSAHQQQGLAVTLNLTGGTKLMTLAALQAAYGSGSALLYVATETNQVIWMASDGAVRRREPIQVKISAAQYLAAHGLEVRTSPNPAHQDTPGFAFEDHLAHLLRQSGLFDDIQQGLHILRRTPRGEVSNELDLVVTRNGRLAVCSCKTGKAFNREAVYELASLSRRESAGIYCGKVLAGDGQRSPTALAVLVARARSMNVSLVYGRELESIAAHLEQATR